MLSGTAGTGPHLHYEVIRTNAKPRTEEFFNVLEERYFPSQLFDLLNNQNMGGIIVSIER